ncbi:hypothetical protein KFZ76_01905 [Methylovulum psychrotolerans]|uniref:hypothetical protein n=1 Tax=Methylovulum psychrotolerans TaxID=1704499 RepID=UPI001BFF7C93|nr:hypothetical protein [Methylovulum psychrotolerans]MBT9096462.1 hypothetical protein [Methylovulum psychrotolerans]
MTRAQPAAALLAALALAASLTAHADNLLPWRKIKLLNDPKTRIFIEGAKGQRQEIPGGARQHFLDEEKDEAVANLCKGHVSGDQLRLRCDRKGGMLNNEETKHVPWWWNYKAKIEGDSIIIYAVSQKDEPFEIGEEVQSHFFFED